MISLRRFIVIVLLILVITIGCVIIIPVCQELSQYLLDIIQDFLLGLGSLLLCLHAMTEITIIIVISYVG